MRDDPESDHRNHRRPSRRSLVLYYLLGMAILWSPVLLSAADGKATPGQWIATVSLTAFLTALGAIFATAYSSDRP